MFRSAVYTGQIAHRRAAPRHHAFDYRLFYLLLDLDELEALDAGSRWFGYNRRACLGFHDADHGAGDGRPFRSWLAEALAAFGMTGGPWRFQVLCMPRIFGYVFNPITIVYCFDRYGDLVAMLYEVNNTFGERVSYLAPVSRRTGDIRQRCDKSLFVSPFFDMAGYYDFRVSRPSDRLQVAIDYRAGEPESGIRMQAWFNGLREPFAPQVLRRLVFGYPATALKVVGGIHFEALKLWLKRTPLAARVAAPDHLIMPGTEL